jgi:SAM-dependent methyltransferase
MVGARTTSGDYLIERRPGEVERLAAQDAALAAETAVLLDAIGVGPGWRCIDIGCGPRGLTGTLSARVGADGAVVGLDYDPAFVATAREGAAENTTFVAADAYATGLPDARFDLVHTRFVASTAGAPEKLLSEAARLARPGGWVAYQEADFASLTCHPPNPAWDALRHAFEGCFPPSGDDPIAHRLYRLMHGAGFRELGYRPVVIGVDSGHLWRDYLPATVESLRGAIVARGLLPGNLITGLLADCRAHLADPATVFRSFTVVQIWGRRPAA